MRSLSAQGVLSVRDKEKTAQTLIPKQSKDVVFITTDRMGTGNEQLVKF